jgi:hypothetical protein
MQESWRSVAGILEVGCRKAGSQLQEYLRLDEGNRRSAAGMRGVSWTIAKGQLQDVLRFVEVKHENSCINGEQECRNVEGQLLES